MYIYINQDFPCSFQVKNVNDHTLENRMESFFLAETTKYLYLLFDTENWIHNTGEKGQVHRVGERECIVEGGGYIFNTGKIKMIYLFLSLENVCSCSYVVRYGICDILLT